MSENTKQGISLKELGAGSPQGGRRWVEKTYQISANAGRVTLYTARDGDVAVTQAIVRAGMDLTTDLDTGAVETDPDGSVTAYVEIIPTTYFPGHLSNLWMDALGKQDDGRLDPNEGSEGLCWDCVIVPEGLDITLNLVGLTTNTITFTVAIGWEPVTEGAWLEQIL